MGRGRSRGQSTQWVATLSFVHGGTSHRISQDSSIHKKGFKDGFKFPSNVYALESCLPTPKTLAGTAPCEASVSEPLGARRMLLIENDQDPNVIQ